MGVYKRGKIYWYKFMWHGVVVRESTKQGNANVARQIEAAHRLSLAKGDAGIRERKITPTLQEFANGHFLKFVRAQFAKKPKTLEYYENGVKRLLDQPHLGFAKLDEITHPMIASYTARRQGQKKEITTINRELEVLRRMFRLATQWGTVEKVLPMVVMLRGENHRERVLTAQEQRAYLAVAPRPLRDVATLILECGLRPEEVFRMDKTNVTENRILVPFGKTAKARREIAFPVSSPVTKILADNCAGNASRWVFPADTASGHIEKSSLRKQHARACKLSGVEKFVLYTFRHTCLTRWAEHMDPFTLKYLAGHESIETTQGYIHPQAETIHRAMKRVWTGHKAGHTVLSIDSLREKRKAANN